MGNVPGAPTVESFVEPFEALVFVLFDMLTGFLIARLFLELQF
jgi:hypothetical protein